MAILKERLLALSNAAQTTIDHHTNTLNLIRQTAQHIADGPQDQIRDRLLTELIPLTLYPDQFIYQSIITVQKEQAWYKLTHRRAEREKYYSEQRRRRAGAQPQQAKPSSLYKPQSHTDPFVPPQWAKQQLEFESDIQYYMSNLNWTRDQAIKFILEEQEDEKRQQQTAQQPTTQQPEQQQTFDEPHFVEGSRFIEDDPQFTIPQPDPTVEEEEEAPPD